jgi:hypothetical protein
MTALTLLRKFVLELCSFRSKQDSKIEVIVLVCCVSRTLLMIPDLVQGRDALLDPYSWLEDWCVGVAEVREEENNSDLVSTSQRLKQG